MADREQLPDIMSGLLGGKAKQPPEVKVEPDAELEAMAERKQERMKELEAALSETAQPAPQPASRTVKQKASKPAKAPPPPDSEEKSKATFYLSQETVDLLEDGWLKLRRLATDRASVSKSAIVEAALEITLEELAKYGEQSKLASKLAYP